MYTNIDDTDTIFFLLILVEHYKLHDAGIYILAGMATSPDTS